jgi:hypothetical protein
MAGSGSLATLAVILVLFTASTPLSGHHGRAGTYAGAMPVTSKVIVKRFDFRNPHVRVYFETKDESGNLKSWSGEMANISQFVRAGWTKARMEEQLKPGTEMTFTYLPSTVPQPTGGTYDSIVMRIINGNGQVVGLVRGGLAEALAP